MDSASGRSEVIYSTELQRNLGVGRPQLGMLRDALSNGLDSVPTADCFSSYLQEHGIASEGDISQNLPFKAELTLRGPALSQSPFSLQTLAKCPLYRRHCSRLGATVVTKRTQRIHKKTYKQINVR